MIDKSLKSLFRECDFSQSTGLKPQNFSDASDPTRVGSATSLKDGPSTIQRVSTVLQAAIKTTTTVKIWNRKHLKKITAVYKELARTGKHPDEITQGVITAIQKPGKPKGPIKNLRPITLLSMLRKFLAICLKKRIIHRLDAEIPPRQAGYIQGRSTTEHILAKDTFHEDIFQ